jgi:hypothetical protein
MMANSGSFKAGDDPRRNTKGTLKRHWLQLFEAGYSAEDYQIAIEALKDAVLEKKSWAIKLIFDKTLPDKLDIVAEVDSTNVTSISLNPRIAEAAMELNKVIQEEKDKATGEQNDNQWTDEDVDEAGRL